MFIINEVGYEEFVAYNGMKLKNSPMAKNVKEGNCKYFWIFSEEGLINDLPIYVLDNKVGDVAIQINTGRKEIFDEDLMQAIFQAAKEAGFEKLEFDVFENLKEKIEKIKEYGFEVVSSEYDDYFKENIIKLHLEF